MLRFVLKSILSVFSCRSKFFFFFFFGFRSYIQIFNLSGVYFLYSIRKCSNFTLTCSCSVFPASLLKGTVFSHCMFLPSLLQSGHKCVGLFWAFCSVRFIYVSVFVPVPCCFDYCSFPVQSKVREHDSSSIISPPRLLWQFRVLCSSI